MLVCSELLVTFGGHLRTMSTSKCLSSNSWSCHSCKIFASSLHHSGTTFSVTMTRDKVVRQHDCVTRTYELSRFYFSRRRPTSASATLLPSHSPYVAGTTLAASQSSRLHTTASCFFLPLNTARLFLSPTSAGVTAQHPCSVSHHAGGCGHIDQMFRGECTSARPSAQTSSILCNGLSSFESSLL